MHEAFPAERDRERRRFGAGGCAEGLGLGGRPGREHRQRGIDARHRMRINRLS